MPDRNASSREPRGGRVGPSDPCDFSRRLWLTDERRKNEADTENDREPISGMLLGSLAEGHYAPQRSGLDKAPGRCYWITWSARARIAWGMVSPSTFAVFALIA